MFEEIEIWYYRRKEKNWHVAHLLFLVTLCTIIIVQQLSLHHKKCIPASACQNWGKKDQNKGRYYLQSTV